MIWRTLKILRDSFSTIYGPRTPQIKKILNQMQRITPEQAMDLSAEGNGRWETEWNEARNAASTVWRVNMARDHWRWVAWNDLMAMKGDDCSAADEAGIAVCLAESGDGDEDAAILDWLGRPHYVEDAWGAADDAIFALISVDLISDGGFSRAHFNVLVKPWESVFGKIQIIDDGTVSLEKG